ncbi:MAG: endonuclease V [Nitrospirae bacterium]|nr:endonuclease V [Nitrospirota bacterium]
MISRAKELQYTLAARVVIRPFSLRRGYVAGVDAAFKSGKVIASACLLAYPGLERVEESVAVMDIDFPYVPGYLSFREAPAITEAIGKLKTRPDMIIADGQGIAHPRRIGLASHLGVLLNLPTIGAAKSRLIGTSEEPGPFKGDMAYLYHDGDVIGAVLRTRDNTKPLYVSPGHLTDLESAVAIVMSCVTRYRLPEPTRCAHNQSALNKLLV